MKLKNRIVEHGEERVDQIMFNPMNWRFHPTEQRRALQGLMRDVGMVQEVIKNKTTGNLVDGHLRVLIADEEGMETIPCGYVEMSETEELLYLIANDRIGGMAATDKEKAGAILDEILGGLGVEDADLRSTLMDFQDEVTPEEGAEADAGDKAGQGPPEMELQPQEHYDYIIVLARNVNDWEFLCAKLGLEKVNGSLIKGKSKIGLGRAVPAERLVGLLDATP